MAKVALSLDLQLLIITYKQSSGFPRPPSAHVFSGLVPVAAFMSLLALGQHLIQRLDLLLCLQSSASS